VLLEYLQGFDSNRYSEVADMFANTLGIIAGVGLAMTPLRFTLQKLEHYFR
jgi:VanZ family protein